MPRTVRAVSVAVGAALAAGALTAAPQAASARSYPWPPTLMHAVSVTATSFTIAAKPSDNDETFRLWASTDYHDVLTSRMNNGPLTPAVRTASSRSPRITLRHLPYSAKTWYYRLEAVNGAQHSFTLETGKLGLRPSRPTGLRAHSSSNGTYLSWGGAQSNGYDVKVATNAAMTAGVHWWHVRSVRTAPQQFTPPGLAHGRDYWMKVRASNTHTKSAWASPVHVHVRSHMQPVRVMTYNLLTAVYDGKRAPSGVRIAPWSVRARKAAALVRSVRAEVIGVQEACKRVDGYAHQVDELVHDANRMGSHYRVANTTRPSSNTYPNHQSGNYIVYDSSKFRPAGPGGYWMLDAARPAHNAVWQVLRPVGAPGRRFLFVTTHLPVQNGSTGDQKRKRETGTIIRHATALGHRRGIPVVYSGDFNSHPMFTAHPMDGPQVAMRSHRIVNDATVAPVRVHPTFDSVNEYHRTAPRRRMDLDYLWLSPGVAGMSWDIVVKVNSHRQFVGAIPSDHNPVAAAIRYPY